MRNDGELDQLRGLVDSYGLSGVLQALAEIAETVPPDARAWRHTAPLHLRTCSELVEDCPA